MYRINNFIDNDDIKILDKKGSFQIAEYLRDLSIHPTDAVSAYFMSKMNVRKRQLICNVGEQDIVIQAGAMQWSTGDLSATTGIKGAGDLFGKMVKSKMTGETAVKPEYTGEGVLVLEPTYKHLILVDVGEWGKGMVLDDGLFLACEGSLEQKIVARSNFSSAIAGGEGLFNLCLEGEGIACIESCCPKEELIEIELKNDVVKIDGNLAVAWSKSLNFTVERSSKTLIGSAASGEGLVNVYRGTGKIWMMPVR